MLKKYYSPTKNSCRVTFKYPNPEKAQSAVLVGDFNNWSLERHVMKKLKDGSFSLTVSLPAAATYHFRYVLDGTIWVNDHAADGYAPNEYGEDNSLLII